MLGYNYPRSEIRPYHVIISSDPEARTGELILGDVNAASDQTLLQEHRVKTIITAAAGLDQVSVSAEQTHIVFPILEVCIS
jgi:hypothetical protein